MEPFAFAGDVAPINGLPSGASEGFLTVPAKANATPACDWALASGTSSWAPGIYPSFPSNASIYQCGRVSNCFVFQI